MGVAAAGAAARPRGRRGPGPAALERRAAGRRVPARRLRTTADRGRALAVALARLLILDEPTSALSAAETEQLFGIVRSLREQGVAILYVSHRLSEVEALADRVAVLREGRLEAVFERPLQPTRIVEAMLGELAGDVARPSTHPGGRAVVRFSGARVFADSERFDLELRAGEVLGLTGLIGAGKSELLGALFGVRPLAAGRIELDGNEIRPRHPAEAIALGVHLVPEDRAAQALIPGWSVRANATLALVRRFFTRIGLERKRTNELIRDLDVASRRPGGADRVALGPTTEGVVGRWLVEALAGAGARRAVPRRRPRRAGRHRGQDPRARRSGDRRVRGRRRGISRSPTRSWYSPGAVVRDVPAANADREALTLAMNA